MDPARRPGNGGSGRIPPTRSLTRRESEVCGFIAAGHTNVEIARRLEISAKTVESHRKHLMSKMGLKRRSDLVRFALEQGLFAGSRSGGGFKRCSSCGRRWHYRGAFLSDPEVSFLGYRSANGDGEATGVMLFAHTRCDARLPCPLEWFQELTGKALLGESCAATGRREEYCLATDPTAGYPPKCVCDFVRHTSLVIQRWPKSEFPP